MSRRAVVTGLGAVSPLGVGAAALFDRWAAGASGIRDGIARCWDFAPEDRLSRKEVRRSDRFTQLAVSAADEALGQAGWLDPSGAGDPERIGCVIGTGVGGMASAEAAVDGMRENGERGISPLTVPLMMPNAAAGAVAMRYKLLGPAFGVVSACAAGADAIGVALLLIRSGEVDAVVAGGSEAPLTDLGIAAFGVMEATSPSGISRPFDARRDGFIMAEGAGMLVIEEEQSARARGATILGELAGYGSSADAFHLVAPDPEGGGAMRAIERALRDASVAADELDYVNAHGTSTELNDRSETVALKGALGPAAHRLPVSSLKSAIGHLLGAAGAVEAVATVQAVAQRVAPPTLNYAEPDDGLDLDYVPGEARPLAARNGGPAVAISNSFGFGGHNSVLCFKGP